MFDYEEILDDLPMDQIAHQVGEPRSEVENAVRNALPALLMGLGANAKDPAGEASIARALQDHDPALLRGGVNLSQVDTAEGAKISHHIFGRNEEAVMNQLGGLGGGSGLIQKLIPILAPIVMAWLAGKFMGRDESQGQSGQTSSGGGGILGDILGNVLGGNREKQAPPPSTPQTNPQFRAPEPANVPGAPTMPFPEEDENPQPQTQQTNQPSGGGLGGGVLGQILGDLLGGGRR